MISFEEVLKPILQYFLNCETNSNILKTKMKQYDAYLYVKNVLCSVTKQYLDTLSNNPSFKRQTIIQTLEQVPH